MIGVSQFIYNASEMDQKIVFFVCITFFTSRLVPAVEKFPKRTTGNSNLRPDWDETANRNSLEKGKEQYLVVLKNSKMPRYGSCWTRALEDLEKGCQSLTDDVQGRLALNFANCFLIKTGQKAYPCEETTPLMECLKDVDNHGFTAYSQFFTHSQSMCHFLQSQIWHEETENTISRLADNSHKVSQKLEDASQLQDEMIQSQKISLDYQEELLASSTNLGKALETSKDNVRLMLEEFRSSTDEQRNLIFEVFNRVSKLQNLVLGEVSGFYSLLFYPFAFCAAYLITAAKRTAEARFWLLVLLLLALAVERAVCAWSIKDDSTSDAQELAEIIHGRTWVVRKIALFCGVLLIGVVAYNFKDYNMVNHVLLLQIQRQNAELGSFLQRCGLKERFSMGDQVDFKIEPGFAEAFALEPQMSEDEEDSISSYDSEASDATYKCLDESESELFYTAPDLETPNLSRDDTNSKSTPQLAVCRYNLRSRSSLSNKSWNCAAIENESPRSFYNLVKKTEQFSEKNSRQIRVALKETPFFSSDEES